MFLFFTLVPPDLRYTFQSATKMVYDRDFHEYIIVDIYNYLVRLGVQPNLARAAPK